MDALLLSLILCLSVEADGALARHYRTLALSRSGEAMVALVATTGMTAIFSALGGHWIGAMLTPEARGLFLAFALVMAGCGLLLRSSAPAKNDERDGSLPAMLLKLFMAGAGSNAPLLIAAISCRFADPWMAGIGGGLGCIAGSMAGRAMVSDYQAVVRLFRYGVGGAMLVGAFLLAISALRLV